MCFFSIRSPLPYPRLGNIFEHEEMIFFYIHFTPNHVCNSRIISPTGPNQSCLILRQNKCEKREKEVKERETAVAMSE